MGQENQICDICGGPLALNDFERGIGDRWFGHNPYPVRPSPNQRCCRICDDEVVIPARIAIIQLEAKRRRHAPSRA